MVTVRDGEATVAFYESLGMRADRAGDGRTALMFGSQKINLHEAAEPPILPRAAQPTPGSADFCLIADRPLGVVMDELAACGMTIERGPIERRGALGRMRSIYLRDPDGNLVEISHYGGSERLEGDQDP